MGSSIAREHGSLPLLFMANTSTRYLVVCCCKVGVIAGVYA